MADPTEATRDLAHATVSLLRVAGLNAEESVTLVERLLISSIMDYTADPSSVPPSSQRRPVAPTMTESYLSETTKNFGNRICDRLQQTGMPVESAIELTANYAQAVAEDISTLLTAKGMIS